jgi:hypothetical protein
LRQVSFKDVRIVGEDDARAGQSCTAYGDQGGDHVTVLDSAEQRWAGVLGPSPFLVIVVGAFVFLVCRPVKRFRSVRRG